MDATVDRGVGREQRIVSILALKKPSLDRACNADSTGRFPITGRREVEKKGEVFLRDNTSFHPGEELSPCHRGVPIRFVAVVLGTRGSRVPGVAAFIRMGLANEFAALLPRLGRGA